MSPNRRAYLAAQALLRAVYLAAAAHPDGPAVRMTLHLPNGTLIGSAEVDLGTVNHLTARAAGRSLDLPRPDLRLITTDPPA